MNENVARRRLFLDSRFWAIYLEFNSVHFHGAFISTGTRTSHMHNYAVKTSL